MGLLLLLNISSLYSWDHVTHLQRCLQTDNQWMKLMLWLQSQCFPFIRLPYKKYNSLCTIIALLPTTVTRALEIAVFPPPNASKLISGYPEAPAFCHYLLGGFSLPTLVRFPLAVLWQPLQRWVNEGSCFCWLWACVGKQSKEEAKGLGTQALRRLQIIAKELPFSCLYSNQRLKLHSSCLLVSRRDTLSINGLKQEVIVSGYSWKTWEEVSGDKEENFFTSSLGNVCSQS